MKRLWIFVLALLLCGCTAAPVSTTEPTAPTVLTEEPWDAEGVLTELVLAIPGGNSYTDCLGFRDNILLWSSDGHREGQQVLELCLIDPAQKTMAASLEVIMPNPVTPQVYGNALYLCDPKTGTVLELDRSLQVTGEWTVPAASAEDAVWYAANRKLWEFSEGEPLRCLFLGDVYWSEEEAWWTEIRRPYVNVDQHRLSGGIVSFSSRIGERTQNYALDLTEGTVITPPQGYEDYFRSGNVWLGSRNETDHYYGISVGGGAMRKISPIDGTLSLLQEGYLLEKAPHDQYLRLYDREGRSICSCRLWENLDGYAERLIWNNALGGYLIHYRPHSGGSRLLFWDIQQGTGIGENLKLRAIPAENDIQDALRAEAAALGERFGVTILVGTDCDLERITQLTNGSCAHAADFDLVYGALDALQKALEQYPEDFFRQLQGETIEQIEFQIVSDSNLTGTALVLENTALLIFSAERMDEDAVYQAISLLTNE